MTPDSLIIGFDRALRTLTGTVTSARPIPGRELPEPALERFEGGLRQLASGHRARGSHRAGQRAERAIEADDQGIRDHEVFNPLSS